MVNYLRKNRPNDCSESVLTIKMRVATQSASWLGLGWGGRDNMMTNADMVIANIQDGKVCNQFRFLVLIFMKWSVRDYFATGFQKPLVDDHQDIFDTSAGYVNGESWMQFSRDISAADEEKDHPIVSVNNLCLERTNKLLRDLSKLPLL
jgi:hypothetical protein